MQLVRDHITITANRDKRNAARQLNTAYGVADKSGHHM
jgi:hypothetical protein